MKRRCTLWIALVLLAARGLSAQTAPAQNPPPAQPAAKSQTQPQAQPPATPDPWAGIRFLIGSWETKTTGGAAQAQAAAVYTFRLELRDHILARHSRSGACVNPDDAECQHNDLLYIYPEGGAGSFKAIYFDNEGHILHYDLSIPKPGTAVFLSDAAQPGAQYRLTYTLLDGVMSGQFEMKLPGQTDFVSYLEWSGKQR